MSGPKPANRLFSTKPPYKAAHICAASRTGTPKTPPPTSPIRENTKRSQEPLKISGSRTRNKRVNSKNTAHRFGFVLAPPNDPQCHRDEASRLRRLVPYPVAGQRILPEYRPTSRTKKIFLHFDGGSDRLQKYNWLSETCRSPATARTV